MHHPSSEHFRLLQGCNHCLPYPVSSLSGSYPTGSLGFSEGNSYTGTIRSHLHSLQHRIVRKNYELKPLLPYSLFSNFKPILLLNNLVSCKVSFKFLQVTKTVSYNQFKSRSPCQALCFQEMHFYVDGIQKLILRGISTSPSHYCRKIVCCRIMTQYSREKR